METCRTKGWQAAEPRARERYRRLLRRLDDRTSLDLKQHRVEAAPTWEIRESELFRDLVAMNDLFVDLMFDPKQLELSVITDSVSIEGIELGEFRIVLHLDTLTDQCGCHYEVQAIHPNPPGDNDSVTHPHVSQELLCEGVAKPAIDLALRQGRLLDFCEIVQQVLKTYNPGDAYVRIEDWEGVRCSGCGNNFDNDSIVECAGCEDALCDSCSRRCDDCGDAFCEACDSPCAGCELEFCKHCLKRCDECDESRCNDCLNEQGRCDDCEKPTEEREGEEATGEEDPGNASEEGERVITVTDTPVHATSVGEAAVPA